MLSYKGKFLKSQEFLTKEMPANKLTQKKHTRCASTLFGLLPAYTGCAPGKGDEKDDVLRSSANRRLLAQ